jgi:hypothetical protein
VLNYAPRHEEDVWRSAGIVPRSLDLETRLISVDSYKHRPFVVCKNKTVLFSSILSLKTESLSVLIAVQFGFSNCGTRTATNTPTILYWYAALRKVHI